MVLRCSSTSWRNRRRATGISQHLTPSTHIHAKVHHSVCASVRSSKCVLCRLVPSRPHHMTLLQQPQNPFQSPPKVSGSQAMPPVLPASLQRAFSNPFEFSPTSSSNPFSPRKAASFRVDQFSGMYVCLCAWWLLMRAQDFADTFHLERR
jgi:hypothetical protein